MAKFRKKPVVIEARQWPGIGIAQLDATLSFEEWVKPHAIKTERWPLRYRGSSLVIPTLEGDHEAKQGDWIIVGVQGEIYPCKPDIFAATYEQVDS